MAIKIKNQTYSRIIEPITKEKIVDEKRVAYEKTEALQLSNFYFGYKPGELYNNSENVFAPHERIL